MRTALNVTMCLVALVTALPGLVLWEFLAYSEFQADFYAVSFVAALLGATPIIFGFWSLRRSRSFGEAALIANGIGASLVVSYAIILVCV
jgi:hypothetical protein